MFKYLDASRSANGNIIKKSLIGTAQQLAAFAWQVVCLRCRLSSSSKINMTPEVPTAEYQYIGKTHPAADALRKVTGELAYGTDLTLPGMLYAHLLLSPHAHARVLQVDAQAALAEAGVVAVYSHFNTPAKPYCRYRILPDQAGCIDDEHLFAPVARSVGDRVAVVVATRADIAARAADLLEVQYELLPAVLDAETALLPGAPAIYPQGNLLHTFDHASNTKLPEGCQTISTTVSTQMLHHAAIEPHMCMAQCDASGKVTLWSACQSVYGARTVVADWLELPYSQVRVIKVPMGGSFGGKQEFILEPLTAFLAQQLRRPVMLALDREACIRGTMVRPMQRSTLHSVIDANGRVRSLQVDTLLAAGPYASSSPDYSEAMAHKLTRLYRLDHYRHTARVAYTNTPVAGGMRGWGAPDIATCAEIHVDHIARTLKVDPVALRESMLVLPHETDLMSGRSLGDARVLECLQRGARAFGWAHRSTQEPGNGRWRTGVGVACGAHKNGMLSDAFPESSSMTLKMNVDGSLNLGTSLHEVGAGAQVMLRLVIAEVLGVPPERITAAEADSEATPYDFGCFGSRVTYICGAAARELALLMRQQLLDTVALLWGSSVEQLEAAHGVVRERAVDSDSDSNNDIARCMSYGQVVQHTRMQHSRDMVVTHTYRGQSNPGSYSVQFAEVQVDTYTGRVLVSDFLCVVDIGLALNPGMVEGQCRGAVQAGIGSALCEELALDGQGRLMGSGLRDYHLINTVEMPRVDVLLIEHPGDDGPFGAKSVGEVATVPTAAAVVNAVNRALGTAISTLPLNPERILATLQSLPEAHAKEVTCC